MRIFPLYRLNNLTSGGLYCLSVGTTLGIRTNPTYLGSLFDRLGHLLQAVGHLALEIRQGTYRELFA